jgi:hypothetical protein
VSSFSLNTGDIPSGGWYALPAQDIVVRHAADGSLRVAFDVSFQPEAGVSPSSGGLGTRTYDVTTIPRASIPSFDPSSGWIDIGKKLTIYTNRSSAEFTHTISVKKGDVVLLYKEGVTESYVWNTGARVTETDMKNVWDHIANGDISDVDVGGARTIAATCYVSTYKGTSLVGQITADVYLVVPNNSVTQPDFTVNTALGLTWNSYILAGTSTVMFGYIATPKFRATIDSVELNGEPYASGTTFVATQKEYDLVATDSRGFQKSHHVDLSTDLTGKTFTAYSQPVVVPAPGETIPKVVRCDSQGTEDPEGTYAKLVCQAEYTNISGNSVTLKARIGSSGSWGTVPANMVLPVTFAQNQSYQIDICYVDTVMADLYTDHVQDHYQPVPVSLPVAFATFHLKAGGTGVGIGQYSNLNRLQVGIPAEFNDTVYVKDRNGNLVDLRDVLWPQQ